MKTRKIEISHKTVIFTVAFLLALAFFWQIRSILVLIFVGFVLMEAVNPVVRQLEKIKIPRVFAILIVYLLIIAAVSFAIAGIIPILIEQTAGLINSLPQIIQNVKIFSENTIDLSSQFKILETIPSNIAKIAVSLASNIFSGLIIFVITFYLLLEKNNFPKYGDNFFGEKGKIKFLRIMNNIESSLGSWVNAQLLLMLIIGLLSYVGYLILGLKYALPLAIIAGLLEAIPNIGPIVTTVIAGLFALTISPLTAIFTVIFGVLVQQLENNFIVPKIMRSTVGLNPLVTILLIITGSQLAGIVGALLAIPLFLTIQAVVKGLSKESE
ncbi:MAG: AI-2E family transporter [Candidatus Shapirobacteria bacterium]|nr:AI-2E family transporter [Candidatus Shapirobacteria bacterium]MDD4410663.1 AI-2E family transporter [Candidatus Shapirobacteria bacterium]